MPSINDTLTLIGSIAALLGVFTGIIFWAVKWLMDDFKQDFDDGNAELKKHLDERLTVVSSQQKIHSMQIDDHEKRLHRREIEQLELRNEMLENMRNQYVRQDDITEIKSQIGAIFDRLDKIIFREGGK